MGATADCIVQKKNKCAMRRGPVSFEACVGRTLNKEVPLFKESTADGWIGDASACLEDLLRYTEKSMAG